MAVSQLSLKACIFSPCVSIEELENVIQMMTIHDSSDKLKKKKSSERKDGLPLLLWDLNQKNQ